MIGHGAPAYLIDTREMGLKESPQRAVGWVEAIATASKRSPFVYDHDFRPSRQRCVLPAATSRSPRARPTRASRSGRSCAAARRPRRPVHHVVRGLRARSDRDRRVKKGAMVPHVQAANRGAVAVLVLFGEEIRGAKQNRIANASFLVPPHSEIILDVSCVEHGRWSRRRGRRVREHGHGHVLRASASKMNARVSMSRRAGFGFRADQGEVWEEVGERVRYARAHAPSGAYSDYLATRQRDLDEMASAFHALPIRSASSRASARRSWGSRRSAGPRSSRRPITACCADTSSTRSTTLSSARGSRRGRPRRASMLRSPSSRRWRRRAGRQPVAGPRDRSPGRGRARQRVRARREVVQP